MAGRTHSDDYGFSGATPPKQESYRSLLDLNMKCLQYILARNRWANPELIHIDLHAGPGIDPNDGYGSPLIWARVNRRYKLPYRAHFFETDQNRFSELQTNMERLGINSSTYHLYNMDHSNAIALMPLRPDRNQFGTIYADPTTPDIPVEVFKEASYRWPKVDLVINIAAASYKRQIKLDHYKHLKTQLSEIKKEHWLIRETLKDPPEIARFQWTMIVLTNWTDYPPSKGFHSLTTDEGIEIFNRVAYTKDERDQQGDQ